ncbi:MAG: gluconate:H+ symporter [Phycisphaeraceae bacterium]
MPVELSFLAGLAVLFLVSIKYRVNAFIGLLLSALSIACLSQMPLADAITSITVGFGKTVASIGIVIILGVMLGKYLEESGGAKKMADLAIRTVGNRRSPLAMALCGYLVAIPVFSDVAFVILSPLAKAMSSRTKISLPVITVSLSAGLLATHVFVPPTPGPLAVAGLLDLDIGLVTLWGMFAALMMTMFGWFWAQFIMPRFVPSIVPQDPEAEVQDAKLPTGWAAFTALLTPMVLILAATTSAMLLKEDHPLRTVFAFIGNANIAMGIGVLVSIVVLGRSIGKQRVLKIMDDALPEAGAIIFITAAGGALGQVLKDSGAGDAVAELIAGSGIPFILVPFVVAALLKAIQGSGTVAVITAATLCLPLAERLNMSPMLIFLASGSGARMICHVNDSYFWVYTKMSGFDTAMGLRTLSASNWFMAMGGLFATWIASFFV